MRAKDSSDGQQRREMGATHSCANWTPVHEARPPEKHGIYTFATRRDVVYIGRAREGTTTLASRFRDHCAGRGNPIVHSAVLAAATEPVFYRCFPCGWLDDPAEDEAGALRHYAATNGGRLPAGNRRGESGTAEGSLRVRLGVTVSRKVARVVAISGAAVGGAAVGVGATLLWVLAAHGRL